MAPNPRLLPCRDIKTILGPRRDWERLRRKLMGRSMSFLTARLLLATVLLALMACGRINAPSPAACERAADAKVLRFITWTEYWPAYVWALFALETGVQVQ